MHFRPIVLAAALAAALAASGAHAQAAASTALPKPAEFYFDADANATKPVVAVRETGEAAMAKLLKLIERKPHASAERAQLAHLAMEAGRVELGRELYARALQRLDTSDAAWRAVMWNYGWDLYRAGDDAAALEQWRTLMTARSVTAAWMPPTFALALWSLGRRDEAVQWYAAAVRTEPDQWAGTQRYAQLLPAWLPAERATLAEVQAAWATKVVAGQ
ncbi:tetratricopeptide repeat protein [Lysobacter koreensis]|uniref:Tetratricopeptide repeat protein n=1 Tax=Lysobacter koreensis TaxID=266122 RepID=A0ABW2YNK8_9GAMM